MVQQILVVENYADLGSAITAALPDEYTCTCVRAADDAISSLRTHRYQVILLAPMLPIQDDPVMHFLHESQPGEIKKVILMTPPDADTSAEDCRVLVKPFNRSDLVAELAKSE